MRYKFMCWRLFWAFACAITPLLLYSAAVGASTAQSPIESQWWQSYSTLISDPTTAYLLLMLGIYGLFIELLHPGLVLPGVVGTIAVLLALYALHALPINYIGLGLIIVGLAFIIAEGMAPAFGILGLSGTISFVIGSLMLMGTHGVAYAAIAAMTVINVMIFIILCGAVAKARQQKVKNGLVTLIGAKGRSLGLIHTGGQAIIRGEIWNVYAQEPIAADKALRVLNATGLLLEVAEEDATDIEVRQGLSQGE